LIIRARGVFVDEVAQPGVAVRVGVSVAEPVGVGVPVLVAVDVFVAVFVGEGVDVGFPQVVTGLDEVCGSLGFRRKKSVALSFESLQLKDES
jgi:hypothetical protein